MLHVSGELSGYKRATDGHVVPSPFDILIRREPLQIRQPNLLFISHTRLMAGGGPPKIGPLEFAPELVVEIISDSETQRILEEKLADYGIIGVEECWVVRPEERTTEVLRLTPGGVQSVGVYAEPQAAASVVFPDLIVPVADIFEV